MLSLLPMNQTIEIHKASSELDTWGVEQQSEKVKSYKARIEYNSRNQSVPNVKGEEIVFAATITMNGVVNLAYEDTVNWTDALGVKRNGKPIQIMFKEDLSGRPLMTKVVV